MRIEQKALAGCTMRRFVRELRERSGDPEGRRWLYVPHDQLSDRVGPLAREDPRELGIVLVENRWKANRRPYHRQKLALVLCNLRHFALEQAARGVAVRHVAGNAPYGRLLAPVIRELGPLRLMVPAERELRIDLQPLVARGQLQLIPHEGWLTTVEQFQRAFDGGKPWRLEWFYRLVRRDTGFLMEPDGSPRGGKFNHDRENRRPWRGAPPAPTPPTFPVDVVKEEVATLIETAFPRHPGRVDLEHLPGTAADAQALWGWARDRCLPHFGPYEDAMSRESRGLFHTRISPLLNNLRLLAADLVAEVLTMELPISSQEGFLRQLLGWREFMWHVHQATDGFRQTREGDPVPVQEEPGDGGWGTWTGRTWRRSRRLARLDGGALASHLGVSRDLPPAYWGVESGLACLDQVVREVWEDGWTHHITRLMVLGNLATLLDLSPRQLTDWFWVAFIDAYDWVVEPNVLGMGSFALDGLFTSKPYISGAAYLDRMSDYCAGCQFSPKRTCPVTPLYWAFLRRHEARLRECARLGMPLRSMARRTAAQRRRDAGVFRRVSELLGAGEPLPPGVSG